MPKLPDISHAQAVRVFSKLGFRVAREGKHTIMSNGRVRRTIPRHNPINAFTMAALARDVGLTPEEFRKLLWSGSRTFLSTTNIAYF
jgi:predicted RNA binding protein YcfA (HicA-like mRNA interferase family)